MMKAKKMRKSMVALALATGMLLVCGGLVGGLMVSNMMGSAMPEYVDEQNQQDEQNPAQEVFSSGIPLTTGYGLPQRVNTNGARVTGAEINEYIRGLPQTDNTFGARVTSAEAGSFAPGLPSNNLAFPAYPSAIIIEGANTTGFGLPQRVNTFGARVSADHVGGFAPGLPFRSGGNTFGVRVVDSSSIPDYFPGLPQGVNAYGERATAPYAVPIPAMGRRASGGRIVWGATDSSSIPILPSGGATGGHIPVWGWSDAYDQRYMSVIGYVDELPFTVPPIDDMSELAEFAAHHSAGNIRIPTYIPQGYGFAEALYLGWANHMFVTRSELSHEELFPLVFNEEHHLGLGGAIVPQENNTSLLISGGDFEESLLDGFDWELAALYPTLDFLIINFVTENDRFNTIGMMIREYGGWGWDDPGTVWQYESPITINGMDGFVSEHHIRLLDTSNNVMYTITSPSNTATDQAALIRIAESLS